MNRATFLIDGFNLYHSVREAENILQSPTRWLNIKKLCSLYLPRIHGIFGEKVELKNIYYFSALAYHVEAENPGATDRHKDFMKCLKDTGVSIELSRFKPRQIKCRVCNDIFVKHEEKETDVALGAKLLEIFFANECDTAVLLTGDTDLAPAFVTAKRLFPDKNILFMFPFKRKNRELKTIAPDSFKIKGKQYANHQFPDPYQLSNGTLINKPPSW